jgi:hypothetical protein
MHSNQKEIPMRSWLVCAVLLLGAQSAFAQSNVVQNPLAAERFATLPPEADFPEGITADPASGDLFVGTFDVKPDGSGTNFLLRFDRRGRLKAQLALGLIPTTGLAFNPADRKVYFARPGALFGAPSLIQRIPASFDAMTAIEDVVTIPNLAAPPPRTERTLDGQAITATFPDSIPAPNGLAFGQVAGATVLMITDSLQGAVFALADPARPNRQCDPRGACPDLTVLQDTLLASAAFPQLGVNGVTFLSDGGSAAPRLFLTNTGDDRLLELPLGGGPLAPVAESLEGADGIVAGPRNTLIVSMALGDEIAILDATSGRILAELGEFRGIRRDGSVRGLLFPGSIVLVGDSIFASNLALPLTGSPAEPELDVTTYTIARIRIPRALLGVPAGTARP